MVDIDRVMALFADARDLQSDALEMLAQGRIRNAAEKAWGATKRATDALVLARTGDEPELPAATASGLRQLQAEDRVDSGRGQNRTLRLLSALWPPVFAGEQDVGPPKGEMWAGARARLSAWRVSAV